MTAAEQTADGSGRGVDSSSGTGSTGGSGHGFVVSARSYHDPDVTAMIEAAQNYYVSLYGTPDESEIDASEFVPPAGLFLVGSLDGAAVASGAWRTVAPGVAEIKRMYIVPSARRRGLARAMLAEIEHSAAQAGARRLVLVTGIPQTAALALYREAGYRDSQPYGRYAGYDTAVFLGRDL